VRPGRCSELLTDLPKAQTLVDGVEDRRLHQTRLSFLWRNFSIAAQIRGAPIPRPLNSTSVAAPRRW